MVSNVTFHICAVNSCRYDEVERLKETAESYAHAAAESQEEVEKSAKELDKVKDELDVLKFEMRAAGSYASPSPSGGGGGGGGGGDSTQRSHRRRGWRVAGAAGMVGTGMAADEHLTDPETRWRAAGTVAAMAGRFPPSSPDHPAMTSPSSSRPPATGGRRHSTGASAAAVAGGAAVSAAAAAAPASLLLSPMKRAQADARAELQRLSRRLAEKETELAAAASFTVGWWCKPNSFDPWF